jgi:hypothetical protein
VLGLGCYTQLSTIFQLYRGHSCFTCRVRIRIALSCRVASRPVLFVAYTSILFLLFSTSRLALFVVNGVYMLRFSFVFICICAI